jgi:L-Ala-D/L-Glu epimerase
MKVGGAGLNEDLVRVFTIHQELPDVIIRLDANQAFTPEAAVAFTASLLDKGVSIELIEQPVPKEDIPALDRTAQLSPVPVIADEACKSVADAEMLFTTTAVQGVNVKLMKSGLRGALEIIQCAQQYGKQLMIGCMLEAEIGMAASIALAAGTGAFHYVDLDGHLLVKLPHSPRLFTAEGPLLRVA